MDLHSASGSFKKAQLFILCILLVSLCIRPAVKWLNFEVFDMDEAGQFWMAKGLNHDSAPHSSFGTLQDALENNRYYNMDPGGFTALLFGWSKISNDIHFLRILPIIFYWLFVLGIFLLGKSLFRNYIWAFAFTLLSVLPSPAGLHISIPFAARVGYLRAYSMEMCGVALSVWYILKHEGQWKPRNLLKLSLLMSFFCTGRYGFVMTAFALSLYILYDLLKNRTSSQKLIRDSIVFGLPLLLTVALVYFGETRFQNGDLDLLPYYQSIRLNPRLLYGWLSVSFYLILLLNIFQSVKGKGVHPLYAMSCLVGLVFFVLSCMNKYPWTPVSTMPVTVLTQFSLLHFVFERCRKRIPERIFMPALVCLFLMLNIVLWPKTLNHLSLNENTKELAELEAACSCPNPVLISSGMNPVYRYLFEWGALKHIAYPSSFVFETGTRHPDAFFSIPEEKPKPFYHQFAVVMCDHRLGETAPEGFEKNGEFTYINPSYATER